MAAMKTKLLASGDADKTYAVVFDAGDEAVSGLLEMARERQLPASHLTAIGAFSDVTLGYFDVEARRYLEIPVHEQVEVLSLVGDITQDEEGMSAQVHAHFVVGFRDGTTRGGHLLGGTANPTLEVVLVESPAHLRRRHDDATGLALIEL
jgi:predicted DNA-binding protein with PD1-like motif